MIYAGTTNVGHVKHERFNFVETGMNVDPYIAFGSRKIQLLFASQCDW